MERDDCLRDLMRNKSLPVPPLDKFHIFTGGTEDDFRRIGVDVLRSLIDHGNLRRDCRVLEIGSGVGRIAIPLTQWLCEKGSYVGVEIIRNGVTWCRENISTQFQNFKFVHLDIFNEFYNPKGQLSIAEAKYDFKSGSFDLVIFCSVFTHLWRDDAQAYLRIVRDLLTKGGVIWSTWFVIDDEVRKSLKEGRTTIPFIYEHEGVHFLSDARSTAAVGYDETLLRSMFDTAGLKIERFRKGGWCDHSRQEDTYQDLVVAN